MLLLRITIAFVADTLTPSAAVLPAVPVCAFTCEVFEVPVAEEPDSLLPIETSAADSKFSSSSLRIRELVFSLAFDPDSAVAAPSAVSLILDSPALSPSWISFSIEAEFLSSEP